MADFPKILTLGGHQLISVRLSRGIMKVRWIKRFLPGVVELITFTVVNKVPDGTLAFLTIFTIIVVDEPLAKLSVLLHPPKLNLGAHPDRGNCVLEQLGLEGLHADLFGQLMDCVRQACKEGGQKLPHKLTPTFQLMGSKTWSTSFNM